MSQRKDGSVPAQVQRGSPPDKAGRPCNEPHRGFSPRRWKVPRHPAADAFILRLLGLSEEDLAEHEALLHASLDGVTSDRSSEVPSAADLVDYARRSLRSMAFFAAIFRLSTLLFRRWHKLNLHRASAPAESAARVASFVHALTTACAAGVLTPWLWSRCSASEFATILFSRRSSRAEARLTCLSNGYFMYDAVYLLAHEPDPLFLAHHVVCLAIWNGILARGRGGDMVSGMLLLGEATTPLLSLWWLARRAGNQRLARRLGRVFTVAFLLFRTILHPAVTRRLLERLFAGDYDRRIGKLRARLWVGLTSAAVLGGFVWAKALVKGQMQDIKQVFAPRRQLAAT